MLASIDETCAGVAVEPVKSIEGCKLNNRLADAESKDADCGSPGRELGLVGLNPGTVTDVLGSTVEVTVGAWPVVSVELLALAGLDDVVGGIESGSGLGDAVGVAENPSTGPVAWIRADGGSCTPVAYGPGAQVDHAGWRARNFVGIAIMA